MYKVEKKDYGIRLTFGGFMDVNEMTQWVADFKPVVDEAGDNFGVFVDMRDLKPISPNAQVPMREGQTYARENGMVRSVVIVDNDITLMQFKRIAKRTGIYEWERYLSAEDEPNWEKRGLDWIVSSIDPDA